VAQADPAIRQARHLDAVAVGEAQWALDPGWSWTGLCRAAGCVSLPTSLPRWMSCIRGLAVVIT